ncbi:MAG: hypothetical protein KKA07_09940 [Bacteroidetes bacterium]|nr:hypothetical protein [Bacteroidota bacterium]MBU1719382.1 hypothetical protein [Bacteroidota bacterium]
MMRKTIYTVVIFFAVTILADGKLCAQWLLPMNREIYQEADKKLLENENAHLLVKPYAYPIQERKLLMDSLLASDRKERKSDMRWFYRKLRYESLIDVDSSDFSLQIDPLVNLVLMQDKDGGRYYTNTRGVMIAGNIGKDFSFYSDFYENQSVFPSYVSSFINAHRVVPGQGLRKRFKENGYDYSNASGSISYRPSRYFHFLFGHGKNFVGDGYRSLLLSDASYNYPFLRITTEFWKIKYTNIYASFIDMRDSHSYESGFARKYGTMHALSYNVCKALNIGLFEAVIWQAADSTGRRGFDVGYLNPVIFYHPVQLSLGSPDNVVLGMNVRLNITRKLILYGQAVLDDLDLGRSKTDKGFILNKFGGQGGVKWFDPFKIRNLYVQGEVNIVKPYVFAHKTRLQNYAHYEQPLGHPQGANFAEGVGILNYRYKNLFAEFKITYTIYGGDTGDTHWGHDVFQSDYDAELGFASGKGTKPGTGYGNVILQGVRTTISYQDFRISYLLNPRTNLNVSIGATGRFLERLGNRSADLFVYVAIRSSLRNLYFDF